MLSHFESPALLRSFDISCTAAGEIAASHQHANLTLLAAERQPARIAGNLPRRAGGNKWKFNEREEHFRGREISIGRLTGTRAGTLGPRARMPGLPFRKYDVALVLWPSAALLDDSRRRGAGPRIHEPVEVERIHGRGTPRLCTVNQCCNRNPHHAASQIRLDA